ncbi:hypothetical protein FRX31_009423 [Thalictrum thalictroides]|uniref:DUF4283 domain-containing protein n=1 Tax=Thalictrum thalictroides TaxID=46969 RepID=A0A7J6WWE2_THATH|nr:hypothetical protein FRX31_009423 [Thalictrum thalictroides]
MIQSLLGISTKTAARKNRRGEVLKFNLTFGRGGGRPKFKLLCFPARENKEGWAEMGAKLLQLLEVDAGFGGANVFKREEGMKPPPQIDNFAVRNSSSVRVEIKSRGPVTNGEEWARAVICSSTDSEVDWIWVKEKVDSRFLGGCLRVLDNGEAVLMMKTVREAEQIAEFTPLWTESGVVTFRRWRPNEGSLDLVHERVNNFWISFKGIPLHLRNKAVVESLASACGSLIQIDEDSLTFGCGTQRAKLKGEGKRPLPRSVWLEEKS